MLASYCIRHLIISARFLSFHSSSTLLFLQFHTHLNVKFVSFFGNFRDCNKNAIRFQNGSFSLLRWDNSLIPVALESYDPVLSIKISYMPDSCEKKEEREEREGRGGSLQPTKCPKICVPYKRKKSLSKIPLFVGSGQNTLFSFFFFKECIRSLNTLSVRQLKHFTLVKKSFFFWSFFLYEYVWVYNNNKKMAQTRVNVELTRLNSKVKIK